MKLSIAFLAIVGSSAATPVRMRTAERIVKEIVSTTDTFDTAKGEEQAENTAVGLDHAIGEEQAENTAAGLDHKVGEAQTTSTSEAYTYPSDDDTGSMSLSMSYGSDDVASAAEVSIGIAAGAAVLGAVALF